MSKIVDNDPRNIYIFNGTNFQSWPVYVEALLLANDLEETPNEFIAPSNN